MSAEAATELSRRAAITDEDIIERVRQGELALFEVIMRRHNRRLYRTARAIVGDDSEAEDVLQEAYVRAYAHLDQFSGKASFATWLTKIAVHEALARLRRRGRLVSAGDQMDAFEAPGRGPEQMAADHELRGVLENALSNLPEAFRATFVLRDIEGLSTAETAACMGIPEETVKTRLHRARAALRRDLANRISDTLPAIFPFGDTRCDRVVAAVLARIGAA